MSLFVSFNTDAQTLTASLRVSADYNKTYLLVEDLFSITNIAPFESIWGYRAGLSLNTKLYKSLSLDSELGYSRGGFDGHNKAYRKNIDQIYISVAPEYEVLKFIKLKAGLLLNYNIKNNDWLAKDVEPFNYALTTGISANYKSFELGVRYTHYLNPYFSYKKRSEIFDNGFEYWNTTSIFLGFKFWKH